MRELAGRAVEVARRDGLLALVAGTVRYGIRQSLAWARAAYWLVRGERPLTVAGTTARFDVGTLQEGRELEFLAANEPETIAAVIEAVEPGDVFFDVGAHVGVYSCFAGRAGADVVAFEPYPPNVERLRRNLALNDVDGSVVELALSDAAGEVPLERPEDATPGWSRAAIDADASTTPAGDRPVGDGLRVETARGEDLVSAGEVPTPTVVKIDVEGAEGRVIEGLFSVLADPACRLVLCEVHRPHRHRGSIRDFGDTAASVRERLSELGFRVETLDDRGPELTLRAEAG